MKAQSHLPEGAGWWLWPMLSALVGVLLLGVLTWVVAEWQVQAADSARREALLRQAVALARTINPEVVKTLAFTPADRENPQFLRLRQQMTGYGRLIRQRSIYSMALRNGTLIFGPENLAEDDPMASPPGTVYEQASPLDFEVFQTGNPYVYGPATDEYGTFVTAIAPVIDPRSGAVLMVIGMDVLADEWLAAIHAARHGPLLGGGALLLLLLAGMVAVIARSGLTEPWRHRLRHLETVWTGGLGLGLTLAAALLVVSVEERRLRSMLAMARVGEMQQVCDTVLAMRNDLAVLARFHQGQKAETDEFDAFTEPMLRSGGVRAVAWAPRESTADGDAYRIHWVTDFPGRAAWLGCDLAAMPGVRAVMEKAARTGLMYGALAMSGCPGAEEDLTMLVVNPVFFPGGSAGMPDGFVVAILQPQEFLGGVMRRLAKGGSMMPLLWLEVSEAGEEILLAAFPDVAGAAEKDWQARARDVRMVYPIFAFGRAYALVACLVPSGGASLRQAGLVGLFGVLLTAILASFVGFLRNREVGLEHQARRHSAALAGQMAFDTALIDTMPSPIYYKDAAGRYIGCNRAFEAFHGTRREDLIGKTVHDIAPPEMAARYAAMDQELFAHPGRQMYEWLVKAADGTETPVIFHKATFNGAAGEVAGIVGVILDISDRHRAEKERQEMEHQLFHAQKFESLGVMAGGIAHDFNNLLTAVLGNIELVKKSVDADSPAARRLQSAHQAANRAAELSAQMLAYSGRVGANIHALDLNQLVEQHAPMLRTMVARAVPIQLQLGDGIPEIQADPGQLRQVLINLVTNAFEAIGERPDGRVEIATGVVDATAGELRLNRLPTSPPPGKFAWLMVQDNGCGMDANTLHNLFDPFFTTKFLGRGLGMSAVLGIVKEHGGAVFVDSRPGAGTTCRILFPLPSD